MTRAVRPRPALALVTLIPLAWLLVVTGTAGVQKIFHPKPAIGFLAKAQQLKSEELPRNQAALEAAQRGGLATAIDDAQKAMGRTRAQIANNRLDAGVTGAFLGLVILIVLLSVWEWIRLLAGWKPAQLRESPAQWLPAGGVVEGRPVQFAGWLLFGLLAAKELSGQAAVERVQARTDACRCGSGIRLLGDSAGEDPGHAYVEAAEQRLNGPNRCC